MNRKIIFLIITLLTSKNITAQDDVASNIIEEIITNNNYKNIVIDFDLLFKNKQHNINTKQKGNLIIQGEKFILDLENQKVINNGEYQWIYIKEMNEVQITNNDAESNNINPYNIIKEYKKEYKYEYIGKEEETNYDIIMLYPIIRNSYLKDISIIADKSKNKLKKLILSDKSGGTYTYLINYFKGTNEEIEIFFFNKDLYPDVDIIDLR